MLETWLFAATLGGLAVGSFLNVVIHRLPKMLEREWRAEAHDILELEPPATSSPQAETPRYNLAVPRSACPHCGHQITALENIPVLSWLALRGKCSACKAPISVRYPLVEAATAALFFAAVWHFGPGKAALGAMFLIAVLIALALIDFDTQFLPDNMTLPLVWAGLLFNLNDTFASISSAVIGAAAGYMFLWIIYQVHHLLTGREGMGFGDFKLLAALGAWMGWQNLPLLILLSSFVGAVVGLALMVLAKRGKDIPMPFGPYLAGAGLIALFWAPELNQLYLGKSGLL